MLLAFHARIHPPSNISFPQMCHTFVLFDGLQRLNFCTLGALAIPGLCFILPINIFGGNIPIPDELVAATVSHLVTGSSWFWLHAAFVIVVAFSVHKGLDQLDQHLLESRYRECDAVDTIAVYTLMIRGVPRGLARDKQVFETISAPRLVAVIG